MAEAVVGRALLAVLEDVVGLVDFLEFDFGGVVAGIAIGMQLFGELAIGGFQLLHRGALLAAQSFVIAALHGWSMGSVSNPKTSPWPGLTRPPSHRASAR